jgi:hypothetical protein
MIDVITNICRIVKLSVVSPDARLSGDKPLAESDKEHEGTDAKADLSYHDTEEDGESYACEHLSDTRLIVVVTG